MVTLPDVLADRSPIQVGFVVTDFDAAVAAWAAVGAGPFFRYERLETKETFIYGKSAPIRLSGAVGQWGSLQVELLHFLDPGTTNIIPPAPGMGRLHHVNIGFVDDLDAEKERFAQLGVVPGLEIWLAQPEGAKVCLFDARELCGFMINVYEENAGMRQAYEQIAAMSQSRQGQ